MNSKKKKSSKVQVYKKKIKIKSEISLESVREEYQSVDESSIRSFADLPLSRQTKSGLDECKYLTPTDIQKKCIKLAMLGHDVLAAAKTGSGKTLAFLIPILEILYHKKWSRLDGLGALVITPTRELAFQIFEVLNKIGHRHDFSAGLIIGGKDLKFERKRMNMCNIVIGTPGRVLQHMDENPLFDCVTMQVLVLDEADRCLDMGFETQMNGIIANLPPQRQTLLYSATQTKSVKDLARLSLKDACYINVHERDTFSTPNDLSQIYGVCPAENKVMVLWSFIRNHQKKKIIVFMSSCKQVKYIFEIFSKLRPGVSLLALYGSLHQMKRMEIYSGFCRKVNAVLFATDIAARGLDFPAVDWVVQMDCPEDGDTYIHRVGRTARFLKGGQGFLMLLPSEERAMISELEQKKIPLEKIDINQEKLFNPSRKMEAFLARDVNLKERAQRAFTAYIKSIYLMKNKEVFNVDSINLNEFAKSLGLLLPPRIRFLQRRQRKTQSENNSFANMSDSGSDSESFMKIKRADHDVEGVVETPVEERQPAKSKSKRMTKAALAKKLSHKGIKANTRIVFDEDGVPDGLNIKHSELAKGLQDSNEGGLDIATAKLILEEEDKLDRENFRRKVKAQHKQAKEKLKKQREAEAKERDESSGSESGPDLSWLPDPDKIYGKKSPEEGEESEGADDDIAGKEANEDKEPKKLKTRHLKRKKKVDTSVKPAKSRKTFALEGEKLSSLSVNETEELAMLLLNK